MSAQNESCPKLGGHRWTHPQHIFVDPDTVGNFQRRLISKWRGPGESRDTDPRAPGAKVVEAAAAELAVAIAHALQRQLAIYKQNNQWKLP